MKRMAMYFLTLVALLIGNGPAFAESVPSVAARVDAAYANGQIDSQLRSDLKAALDSAKNASQATDYTSATEAYNLLAPASLAASFNAFGS